MINKITLIGHCGKDPEVRTTTSGKKVASFSLATSETHKNTSGEKITETQWHNIKLWERLAEIAESYIKKGQLLYIEGKVVYSSYEDKEGVKRNVTDIIGHNIQMLGRKDEHQVQQSAAQTESISGPTSNEEPTDDLPF